jgi:pSer/pThr/pTyr-binding forkhead associated (FHA) protein
MAKLTFVLEDGQEIVVPMVEHITIGREEDNDVVVDDDRVSKRHAELVRNADGSIQLFDSNSTAGTFVNGERVRSHTILHGDQLAFGPLTAVLDLEETGTNGSTITLTPTGSDTQALTSDSPVKAGRIGTRKKSRGGRREFPADQQTALPAEELLARQQADQHEAAARFEMEKVRLQAELDAMQKALGDWRQRSESERAMHLARVETLRAEEERLSPIKTAVDEAEATHGEWLKSIQALAVQHVEQTAALQRLTAEHNQKTAGLQRFANDEAAARHELEGLATHRDQALAHLQQIRAEAVHDETALDDLRRQMADLETRSHHTKEIAEVREDQVKTAEKKLEQMSQHRVQLEAHIHELTGTEEKLAQALAHCRDAEARHATLTAAIAALGGEQERSQTAVRDLESRIATLNESHQQASAATAEALSTQQRTEKSLRHLQDDITACEDDLASATQRLEETTARRAQLDQQCLELADTGQKLADVERQHAAAGQQLAAVKAAFTASESQVAEHKSIIQTLAAEESATKGRIDVLHAREKDLRSELTQLAAAERGHRARFEEVRQLAAEAEREHAAQQQKFTSSLETSHSELSELVSRLTPLRDWKEAMDLLYARLATLPQDSAEARDLFREIEKEKAGLHQLITAARTQAHAAVPAAFHSNTLSQIAAVNAEAPRGARAGGALGSGTAQETTLRSRLSHLRESVQREETRLEHLRLERTRHEAPHRSSPAAEAMMREQSRHLETKIRQEQERHHALLCNIETSQVEEEKRRERLSELEHKLVELRADITEAERQRSELRQQADLAHTELKNYEAAIDRVTKKTTD